MLPLVPVMVSVNVPRSVPLLVTMRRIDEPEPVTDGGMKLAVAWRGSPVTLKATVPPKPFTGVTVTV